MKIVIYQTSDLHGYIYPTNYVNDQPLGFLKIASYILNDEKKYDASLKIDCGDLVQGSALTHFLSKQAIEENPIIKGLEFINYNVYVLGNHEFNYGLEYLTNAYDKVSDKVINANIKGLPFNTKPYEVFDFNGFKIGCIGFTTVYIPNWEQEVNIKNLEFLDIVKQYAKYEKELKDKCDFIIVCYHGGFEKSLDEHMTPTEALTKENQGSELLENFDSINMILSGHQHRSFITKIKDVICSQPMHNGQSFTKIVIDTESKDISYELIDVSKLNNEIDKKLESIFTQTQKDLDVYLDKIIGEFDKDMRVDDIFLARLKGHPFINFLHQVQLDVSGADFSALSVFDSAIGFSKKISVRDVLINYPYPNTLKVLEVTGKQLKEAIEKSATYFVIEDKKIGINKDFLVPKVQHYNYDTYGGLEYKIDLSRDFYDRVVYMKKDGKDISMDDTYTIVLNNYRASNTSIYPAYEGCRVVKEINLDMSEIILDYIQKHKKIIVDDNYNYFID
ncbi:5'-nucleotidase protein [Romboutsia ilealis]|uniref:5'-nucleotidase protein n=1 Tax=Romboutsia ilealis TaxID=1115758 RepID=A0A1V1I200_9FIRM|nr:bifunctional UDP-sugar hydrolase/5'-nucleotidase [Romboutsia ilealis]CED94149.1 5'-nucleotidase protein [Romboutsia ilealis]